MTSIVQDNVNQLLARSGGLVILQPGIYLGPIDIAPPAGQDYAHGLTFVQYGGVIEKRFSGPLFRLSEAKDMAFMGLEVMGDGDLFEVRAKVSSSRLWWDRCNFRGGGVSFIDDGNGADICQVQFARCTWTGAAVASRVIGGNALDFVYSHCIASGCKRGFDHSRGGAVSTWSDCGGSDTDEFLVVNAGYEFAFHGNSFERVKTVVRVGGDDAGGKGATMFGRSVRVQHVRDCTNSFVVQGSGKVVIDVGSALRAGSLTFDNQNDKADLVVRLSEPAMKLPRALKGQRINVSSS